MSDDTGQQTPDRPMPAAGARGTEFRATIGQLIAGRYRLDGVIGEGSMGTVWAATDQVLHRRVAIKDIKYPPGLPAAEVGRLHQRLLSEARAVAALSHPNVVTVYDVLTTASGPVIVMELLQAQSVADIVGRHGRRTAATAAAIGAAVASALSAAHAAGVIHRDVKPANVLIGNHDDKVTLTDFGLARKSGEATITGGGSIMGSPAYIAPEVAQGGPVDPISDAWSLGALLFYCVQGGPPFDQGSAFATLRSVVADPIPPHPHSGALGPTISGLLVKTPSLRMPIQQAVTALTAIVNGAPGVHAGRAADSASSGRPAEALPLPPPRLVRHTAGRWQLLRRTWLNG
jgi:serine/threonine protein kinase